MEKNKKNTCCNHRVIVVAVIAIIGIFGMKMSGQNKGHRVIKVDKVSGEASLEREKKEQELYEK